MYQVAKRVKKTQKEHQSPDNRYDPKHGCAPNTFKWLLKLSASHLAKTIAATSSKTSMIVYPPTRFF